MKTKVGQALLKHHSRQINLCHDRMEEIAKEMEKFKTNDFSIHPDSYFANIFAEFRKLQKERDEHQAAVTTMCFIEAMLPQKPAKLKGEARNAEIARLTNKLKDLEKQIDGGLDVVAEYNKTKKELQKVMNG